MVEVTGVDDDAPTTNTTNPQLLSQDGGQAERVGLESSRGASSILNPQMPTADTASPHLLSCQIDAQIRQILGDSVERMSFYSQIFDESLSTMFDLQPTAPTAATSNSQFSTATHSLFEGLMSTEDWQGSFLEIETYDQSLSMASTSNSQSSTSTHSLSEGLIPTARQLLEPTFGFEWLSFDSQTFDESLSTMFDLQPTTPTAATSNSQFSTSTHSLFEGLISTARDRQLLEPTFGFQGLFLDSQTPDQSLSMVFDPQPAPIPTASTSNSQSSTSTHSVSEGLIPTARQLLEPTFGFECLSFDSQTFDESLSMIFDLQPPTATSTTSNSQFSTSTHSLSEGLISTARDRQLLEPTFGFRGSFLDTETYDQSLSMVFDPQLPPFPIASTSNSQSSTSTHSLSEGLIPIARQLLEPTFGFDCLSDPDYEVRQALLPMTGLESL